MSQLTGRGGKSGRGGNSGGSKQAPRKEEFEIPDPPVFKLHPPVSITSKLDAAGREETNARLASLGCFVNWDEIDDQDPLIAAARRRLPNLERPGGNPLRFEGTVGGTMTADPSADPRLVAMSMGFPVSIHPLRIPNTRAQTAGGVSVIDYKFLRLSGLLHKMIPLRSGVDDVKLRNVDGSAIRKIYGRVAVTFDAHGFEFQDHMFWVMDLGFPVEMQLGQGDFFSKYNCSVGFQEGGMVIHQADAKKVRNIEDVYVVQ